MTFSSIPKIQVINYADRRKNIAFVYSYPSSYWLPSFVEQDFKILSQHFNCEIVNFRDVNDVAKILKLIAWSDICFSWFASGHSFVAVALSMMLGKKSMVVAGGYDVAYAPEINYGQYTLGWMSRKRTNFTLKHADLVLAVSDFTRSEAMARARPRRIEVIYNAVDTDKFRPAGSGEDTVDAVVTVASGLGDIIRVKGLHVFVKAAALLPEVKFTILGLTDENKQTLKGMISSKNVELCGYMSQEDLLTYYQRAKVYCQLSYRESFGIATAEAMACGCVPVVTDRGALPEVVGDKGIYVPYGDEKATAEGINNALNLDNGVLARKRIEDKFSRRERERSLLDAIESLY